MSKLPKINWIRNHHDLYNTFEDGSIFLVALQVNNSKTNKTEWEIDCVQFDCDGESASLRYRNGDSYDAWAWSDFEYFALLDGSLPTAGDKNE